MMIYLVNAGLIVLAVLIHYEVLRLSSRYVPQLLVKPRIRVLGAVLAALCAHVAEIWLFGAVYYWMSLSGNFGMLTGTVVGVFNGTLMDSVYFSFTTYSSLGLGDIQPHGDLRFLAGLEALLGLVLIAWTASFVYLMMSSHWNECGLSRSAKAVK